MSTVEDKITRDQLEAKFREMTGGVAEEVDDVRSQAMAIGLAVVVASVAIVYLIGRRRGRRRSTIVEVRRI
jgi:hypothetical protein